MTTNANTVFSSFAYSETLEVQALLYARHRVACEVRTDPDGAWSLEFRSDQQTDLWPDVETVRGMVRDELPEMQRGTWHAVFSSDGKVRESLEIDG